MIEIEKKFRLTAEQTTRLTADATLLGQKHITDIYYDNATYDLTRKDHWLRKRNGRFELKLPINDNDGDVFIYNELENDADIMKALGISGGTLEELLAAKGYEPFCTCKTTRTKYSIGDFGLDLDKAEFEDFSYEIAEIEVMAESEDEVKAAEADIEAIAAKYELSNEKIRGKILEYIVRKRPEHLKALQDAWSSASVPLS